MQPFSSPQPLPDFERPSEAVVYCALESLCGGVGGRFMLPLPQLAQHARLSLGTTKRAVTSLTKRGLIRYRRGHNQHRPAVFEMPMAPADLPHETPARPSSARPSSNDGDDARKEFFTGDENDRAVGHLHDQEDHPNRIEQLACRIADGLGDMKNLRLYRSYCRRFPANMILEAYVRAKEPTPDKIKVSRGALFNFLVQLYAKREDK